MHQQPRSFSELHSEVQCSSRVWKIRF